MSLDAQQLFALLPAVYRTRDAQNGGQLQALFGVIAAQSAIVEQNIEQLYDDQFIETCAPWAIPYIGDLLGYNSIYEVAGAFLDARAEVANTIGYRRRKGTLVALEQVCSDASGRTALVVEEFRHLITTASMRYVEAGHLATVDLRDGRALSTLNTAFDTETHTIDVRRIAPRYREPISPDTAPLDIELHGPGRCNIPNIAIHVWRWQQSFPITGPAFALGGGRFLFSSLGSDMPLFTAPAPRAEFTAVGDTDMPRPMRRCELLDLYAAGAVQLIADGVPVAPGTIYPANLADRAGGAWCTVRSGAIAIDAELGRIQYAADLAVPDSLEVSYSYGFPAPIGGGPYDRTDSMALLAPSAPSFFASVGTPAHPTLEAAVAAWNAQPPGVAGLIVIPGSPSLPIDLSGSAGVKLAAGSSLAIAAGTPTSAGDAADVVWKDIRPTLRGDIEVVGAAGQAPDDQPGELVLSGLWVAGQLRVGGVATTIELADSTLVPGLGLLANGEPVFPGEPSIRVTAPGATLVINRAVLGPIAVDENATTRICSSIVDASSPSAVAYAGSDMAGPGADLQIVGCTVIGKVWTRTLTLASNTIFVARLADADPWSAPVWASRRQAGCVRFCSLPSASITPSRYNCLPPDSASEAALAPAFVTLRYGDPAYALLSGYCPLAVWNGADNGSQIGAYLQIQETEAIANVQLRAPEYLPALLESGVVLHPSGPQPAPVQHPGTYGYGAYPYGTVSHDAQPSLPGIGAELI